MLALWKELITMTNEQKLKIVNAVCTCISTIAAVLLVSACTMSMSIQKNNSQSHQTTNQSTKLDSVNNALNLK